MKGSNNSLGRLTTAEHRLFISTAVSAVNGMLVCPDSSKSFSPMSCPTTCASIAFDIAEAMVKVYRERLEPNER